MPDDVGMGELTEGPDHVALARALDAADRGGWTLENPEALARIPPLRRDLSGLDPAETLDAIARDAGLRARIDGSHVHLVQGAPYAVIHDGAEIDLLVVNQRIVDLLQHIATAANTGLDIAPGVDLERRVSMNFSRVPIRTVLRLVENETGTVITPLADGIHVRPRKTPTS